MYTLKESKRYPGLFIKKYKRKVFYNNLWNEELLESRGKVLLADGTIVINPFTKIFNYQENGATIPDDEVCLFVNKINGFMAAATYVPQVGKVVVSTTGSLDSDYVKLAEKYINKKLIKKERIKATFIFEICDSSDPHIIAEEQGIYLIGLRYLDDANKYTSYVFKELYLDEVAKRLGCKRPHWDIATFKQIKDYVKFSKREGVVVYGKTTTLKLKSPYYLVSKAVARIKDISKLDKTRVDEEFYPLIEYIKTMQDFNEIPEQERLNIIRTYYEMGYF